MTTARISVVHCGAAFLVSGCMAAQPTAEVLTNAQMIDALRRCEVSYVMYGGPVRNFTFRRQDGTRFEVKRTDTGPGTWLEAEQRLGQTVSAETSACKNEIIMVVS